VKRALYLDRAPGETRGVVTLDGRPERLLIERLDDSPRQTFGAVVVGRVRRIERALSSLFIDLGEGPDAVMPLSGAPAGLAEGAAIEVEIAAESHAEKGAVVRMLGPAEGPPRLLRSAPALESLLQGFAPGVAVTTGDRAREAADIAEAAALAIEHALPGGGSIAIETTRALVAVDVDLGAASGDARRRARAANLAAISETARLLRLKSLAGLVAIDLVGAGHDGASLTAAAKAAFAADDPGVSIGPISRFGLMQIVTPRRFRPVQEILFESGGAPSPRTTALRLLRALEREGRADGGARLIAVCAPAVARALTPYMSEMTDRIGGRYEILTNDASLPDHFQVTAR
jgi:Ribonuclease G/E